MGISAMNHESPQVSQGAEGVLLAQQKDSQVEPFNPKDNPGTSKIS